VIDAANPPNQKGYGSFFSGVGRITGASWVIFEADDIVWSWLSIHILSNRVFVMESFPCTSDYAKGVWSCDRESAVVEKRDGFGDQMDWVTGKWTHTFDLSGRTQAFLRQLPAVIKCTHFCCELTDFLSPHIFLGDVRDTTGSCGVESIERKRILTPKDK